jgi:putative glutamine amidotransferase
VDKPLIVLTASSNFITTDGKEPRQLVLTVDYVQAVADAGGIPIIAGEACAAELAAICDGLLLTGGPDVAPELYGETIISEKVKPDPARDQFEMELLDVWMKTGKPVFGICRGSQLLNVYFGGTLTQDLELESGWSHRDRSVRHPVHAEKGSILEKLFGTEFLVNTIHHQAVNSLGKGLFATAHSPGGIIEAFEHESLPIFAVQFHPEKMTGAMKDGRTKDFQSIFQYFVDLVKDRSRK